jgi:hypothetical protein
MDALSTFLSPDLTTTGFKTGQRRMALLHKSNFSTRCCGQPCSKSASHRFMQQRRYEFTKISTNVHRQQHRIYDRATSGNQL